MNGQIARGSTQVLEEGTHQLDTSGPVLSSLKAAEPLKDCTIPSFDKPLSPLRAGFAFVMTRYKKVGGHASVENTCRARSRRCKALFDRAQWHFDVQMAGAAGRLIAGLRAAAL